MSGLHAGRQSTTQKIAKYQVEVAEEVIETKTIEVEADNLIDAHRLAYERVVENGIPEPDSEAVESRIFNLTDEDGNEFEAEGNCFERGIEPDPL